MEDGLYQVTTSYLCAGFLIENGRVTECAPILRRKLAYWKTVANLVSPSLQTIKRNTQMSLLSKLSTEQDIADEKDSVGGGSGPLESGLYPSTINMAYVTTSKGGAVGLVLNLKTEDGRDLRQTLWMTSGTAKGCKNYYEDKKGNKQYLPGFNLANSLALLTVGKEINALDTESKVVSIYSFEAKAEVPTKVDMVMDLLNQEIIAGVIKQTVDKNVQDDAGNYVPSGETRDENEIDKFFRTRDRMTTAEIRAQAEEATFIDTWSEKWTGVTRNRAKGAAAAGTAGAPKFGGTPAANTANKKPTQSLFG